MAKLCIETVLDLRNMPRGSGGLFRFILLGLLRGCGPQHGYGLMKALERRSGLRVSSGNFYRELRRLVVEGLVTSVARADRKGEPRGMVYAISDAGIGLFDEWFAVAPVLTGRGPDDLSARTLFFGDADEGAVTRLLEAWERDIWFQNKLLERGRIAALAIAKPNEFAILPLLLSRQVRHLALDVEFLAQVRGALREWRGARGTRPRSVPASGSAKRRGRRLSNTAAANGRR